MGGVARVPRIQATLQRSLVGMGNNAQLRKTLDLDRGIAMGLATLAALHAVGIGALRVPLRESSPYSQLAERLRFAEGKCRPVGGGTGAGGKPSQGANTTETDALISALREENAALLAHLQTAEAAAAAAAAGSGADGEVERLRLEASVERLRLEASEAEGVISVLRADLVAAVARAEEAERKVLKRDKALRRAEGDMRTVEEERDALLLRAKIAEGSPALPQLAGSWAVGVPRLVEDGVGRPNASPAGAERSSSVAETVSTLLGGSSMRIASKSSPAGVGFLDAQVSATGAGAGDKAKKDRRPKPARGTNGGGESGDRQNSRQPGRLGSGVVKQKQTIEQKQTDESSAARGAGLQAKEKRLEQ